MMSTHDDNNPQHAPTPARSGVFDPGSQYDSSAIFCTSSRYIVSHVTISLAISDKTGSMLAF